MDNHLGYGKYERSEEPNYRNGTKPKRVHSKYGEFEVDALQDRQSSFEPQIIPKRKKDISAIDDKEKANSALTLHRSVRKAKSSMPIAFIPMRWYITNWSNCLALPKHMSKNLIDTIRFKLLKIAIRGVHTSRYVKFKLRSICPYKKSLKLFAICGHLQYSWNENTRTLTPEEV